MPIYPASKQQPPESTQESGGFHLLLGWLIAFLLFFALPLGILFEGYRVYLRSISRDERAAFTEYLTRELTSFRNNAANEKVIQQLARNYRDAVRRKLPDFSRTTALSTDLASSLPPGSTFLTWDGKGQVIFPAAAAPAQAFVKALSKAYAEVSQEALVTGEAPFTRFNAANEGAIRTAAPLAGLSFPYLTLAAAPGSIHQHTGTDRHLICFWDTFVSGSLKNGGFSILVPGNNLAESWGLAQILAADPTANPEQTSGFIDPENAGQRFISYKPLASMASALFEQYRSTAKSPVINEEWNLVVLPFSPTSSISLFTLFSTARFRTELENGESLGLAFAALSLLAGIALFFLVYRAASTAGLSLRTKIAGLFGLSMLLPLSILSLLALHYSLDHGKVLQSESNQLLQNEMKRLDDGAGEFYRERAAWLRSLRTHPILASSDQKAITELFLTLYKERKLHRAYLVDASGTVLFDQDHLFDEYGRKAFVGELGRRAIEAGSGLGREPTELIGHDALARNFLARLAAHRGILQPVNWPGTSRRTAAFIDLVPPVAAPAAGSSLHPRALIVTLDLETTDAEYLTAAIREQSGRSDDLRLFALTKEDISVTIPTLNPILRANLLPLVSIAQLRENPVAERISDEKRPLLAALTSGKNLDGYYLGAGIGWQTVTAPLERAYGSLLAALLVSICGSLLLVTLLIRGVVDPISSLSLGTRAIAAGDLTRTLPVLERDELGDLSRAFNEMTKRLRSRLTELTVLYTLTQKASTVTNQREVFALAARHLRDHLAAADCGTAWIDGSDGKPNLAEARGQAAGEVIRKAVSLALQTRVNTLMKLPGEAGTVLGIPLFFEEQDFGGLYLIFAPPGPQPAAIEAFTGDERSFIETLRHHLSLIIEKQRLFEQAITDGLTHLYVRRFFLASLEKEIARARRYRTDVALLMLDIDHFKRFNDSWGHQVGDLVLRETSQRILENIRAIDTPGRYGGEELAVILPQTSLQDAVIVAERIRKAIADATCSAEGNELNVTVSIGVTSVRERRMTMEALISECDKALYKAKAEGRNRVVLAEIELAGGAS
ncbi:MAG TPA: diguanylate cyclase [Candidatus Ozemobacteraceae bacterium]|nr:diguanylate cyclase [Candidatus Ozemobacteraceae bacterium]